MSENEKPGESEKLVDEVVDKVSAESEKIVDKASEKSEQLVDKTVDKASAVKEGLASKVSEMKESNPKVFFGGIAVLAGIVFAVMTMGGSNKQVTAHNAVNLTIGQEYKLKGVNSYDPNATVRLVTAPGSLAAYDDTEAADRNEPCKHMAQGTKVKLVQIHTAIGKANHVQVEMTGGECAGQKGWTNSTNLN